MELIHYTLTGRGSIMSMFIVVRGQGARLVTVSEDYYSLPTEQMDQYNEFLKSQDKPEEKYSVSLCKSYRTDTLCSGTERDVLLMACKSHLRDNYYGDLDVLTELQFDSYLFKLEEQARLYDHWMEWQAERADQPTQDAIADKL